MMTKTERVLRTIREYADVRVVVKEESRLQRFLAKILFFVDYMNYATTFGKTIYVPRKFVDSPGLLAHEGVHVLQSKRYGFVTFALAYLFPQILVVPSLILGFFNPLFFFGLLFLLPLPAPGRMWLEREAYKLNMLLLRDAVPSTNMVDVIDITIEKYFAGPAYYYMWPFKYSMFKEFSECIMFSQLPLYQYSEDMMNYSEDVRKIIRS